MDGERFGVPYDSKAKPSVPPVKDPTITERLQRIQEVLADANINADVAHQTLTGMGPPKSPSEPRPEGIEGILSTILDAAISLRNATAGISARLG